MDELLNQLMASIEALYARMTVEQLQSMIDQYERVISTLRGYISAKEAVDG